MTKIEAARLAAAIAILRPDWPEPSLRTFIERDLAHRPLHDATVALAWIATDPDSRTPARVLEAGPWWASSRTSVDRQPLEPCPIHGNVARRNGQCANCWATEHGIDKPIPHDRPGVPPPRPLRELLRATAGAATTERSSVEEIPRSAR